MNLQTFGKRYVYPTLLAAGIIYPAKLQSQILINVALGSGTATSKTGFAAVGQNTNDFWNFYTRDDGHGGWLSFGTLASLKFADGTVSGAGLTVANAPGAWGNGSADPMYNSYIYPSSGGNITVTVTNLPTGQFDFYVYGIDSGYRLAVGSADYGSKTVPNGPVVNPVVWQEGLQYIVFRSVSVTNGGQAVTVTVTPGAGGYATISGMQISGSGTSSP